MRRSWLLFVIAVAAAGLAPAGERVYVGAAVCRECHGSGHGDQYATWFRSPHARAWAALARPESLEIARLSGIHENPFANPICLGCHATAADTEDWERDPSFHLADGVQCELCHGPGSEYISAEVMSDPDRAAAAGLRIPTATTCLICHKEKETHTTVIDVRPFDIDEALDRISHPGRSAAARPAATGPTIAGRGLRRRPRLRRVSRRRGGQLPLQRLAADRPRRGLGGSQRTAGSSDRRGRRRRRRPGPGAESASSVTPPVAEVRGSGPVSIQRWASNARAATGPAPTTPPRSVPYPRRNPTGRPAIAATHQASTARRRSPTGIGG